MIVGDADGADEARAFSFDKSEPGAVASFSAAIGGMDQVSVGRSDECSTQAQYGTRSNLTDQCNPIRFL